MEENIVESNSSTRGRKCERKTADASKILENMEKQIIHFSIEDIVWQSVVS
jgi:hypothetical protein